MSPYPMAPMPTAQDFLGRLQAEYGVEIKKASYQSEKLTDVSSIRYLYREVDGKKLGVTLPYELDVDKDMMTWPVIRNICDRLEIPKEVFGLTLG